MRQSLLLFARANRRHLAEMVLASVLINLLMLGMPLFSMLVYDKAIGNQVHDTLWALAIGVGLLLALELVMRAARVYLVEHAGARWDTFLDERLMRGVLAAPLTRTLAPADLISKVRELSGTRDALSAQSLLAVADLPFVLLFAGVLAWVGGWLVWLPLGMGALLLVSGVLLQRATEQRHREANRAMRHKISTLMDVLAARESLFGRPLAQSAQTTFRQHSQAGASASARGRWWAQLYQQTVPVLISATAVAVMVAGVYRVEALALSVGGLISVNMISLRLMSLLCTVAPLASRWREFSHALAALGETVDLKTNAAASALPAVDTSALAQEGLRLDGLRFAYPSRPGAQAQAQAHAVLDGVTVDLKPGQIVALVGSSGAGKSTLLKVLAGQLPHTEGTLVFGAHVVADDAARGWVCKQVNHKPQDPCFLAGTVAEVVAAGEPTGTEASLATALRSAGLGPAMDRGEIGLNTPVGTNGVGLSGGQRQSLALASVFHGQHPVVLLDEPTLGLDRVAQDRVLDALVQLRAGRCVVIATHAADVIKRADRVLVLDRGRIVADGPPDRLLAAHTPNTSASASAIARAAAPRPAQVANGTPLPTATVTRVHAAPAPLNQPQPAGAV
jgi:ABC-type bacteriocin/lantibiotic exporter with double-glycine peptidase domain